MKMHGSDAAKAGDLGTVDMKDAIIIGPCAGCGADIMEGFFYHPGTQKQERALVHPVPFCSYFGSTDPDVVKSDTLLKRV